jgi:SAM-dependent methyltransferase
LERKGRSAYKMRIDWRCKALVQLAFSSIPKGQHLNYLFQRYVTRSLPASEAGFAGNLSYAKRHIDAVQRYLHRPIDQATFFEFGAGWDMTIPLAFYTFGVENQIIVDIRNLLKRSLVNDTIEKYQNMAPDVVVTRKPLRHLNGRQRDARVILRNQYGIDYRAPCDARQTGLQSRSIDCITSTSTLEHIPAADITSILRECHRILRDDGLMSVLIDYDDHYSYFDTTISGYNFLQYSDRMWATFNPALHYQNRMRHRDYLNLFDAAEFDIVEEQCKEGTETDLKAIEQLSLEERFGAYSLRELAVRNALIVVRKRNLYTH